jgi:excinuclease UvrABC helicase subunit UvrB
MSTTAVADSIQDNNYKPIKNRKGDDFSNMDKQLAVDMMRTEMLAAAENLEFEKASKLRDEIQKLEKELEDIF